MLIFVDGMGHYTDEFLPKKWDVRLVDTAAGNIVQSLTSGRFGRGGITFTAVLAATGDRPVWIQKNYDGVSTIICGVAVRQTSTQLPFGGRLFTFLGGSVTQVALNILGSGQIQAFRSATSAATGTLHAGMVPPSQLVSLGVSINAISSSSFDFLEIKIVHHPTTGSIEILRNGQPFWLLANVNTAISGIDNSSSVLVGGYNIFDGGSTIRQQLQAVISDFHLLNTTVDGSDPLNPTDFIGDRSWEPLPPTQDGADTAWATTGSANHFANVDEVPPNESDFNSTSTVGARDGFVVQSPTGPPAASALIAVTMFCKKDTGGSNAIKCFARSGGGSYRNGTEFQVPNPYAFRQSFLCSKPGGGAITLADIANHQWGYEKTI